MFNDCKLAGKSLTCDIKFIENLELLCSPPALKELCREICRENQFHILKEIEHIFDDGPGYTLIFILSESHLAIHTFPERQFFSFDLYTCKEYENNTVYEDIYNKLLTVFQASEQKSYYQITDRKFTGSNVFQI